MTAHQDATRMRKSFNDRIIDGVCGGVSEYFGIDPLIVRVGWVMAALAGGLGIVLYLVAIIIMPSPDSAQMRSASPRRSSPPLLVVGIILSCIGFLLLLITTDLFSFHSFHIVPWRTVLPVALIVVGVVLLVRRRRTQVPAEVESGEGGGMTEDPGASRRFYRSRRENKLFGVCGGLGKYFGIDPVMVRLIFIASLFFAPVVTLVAYLVLILFAAEEPLTIAA